MPNEFFFAIQNLYAGPTSATCTPIHNLYLLLLLMQSLSLFLC